VPFRDIFALETTFFITM